MTRSPRAAIALAVAAYLGAVACLLVLSLRGTQGTFIYAQDDPYIHLAIARTLAESGTWGIRPGEFASASSSPAWTLLLATSWALGLRAVWWPFALNVVFGAVAIAACGRVLTQLRGERTSVRETLAALLAVVFLAPLPTLAFIGMEHSLHILLVVMFAGAAVRCLAEEHGRIWLAASLGASMVAVRYESLFLVAALGAALLWRRRFGAALIVAAAGVVPLVMFGAYSLAMGGPILPNSVLMKSGPGRFATIGQGINALTRDSLAILNLFGRPPQLVLTLATLFALLFVPVGRFFDARRSLYLAWLFLAATVLQACLVKLEWFFRYESYLMVLGVLALASLHPHVTIPEIDGRRQRWHPAVAPLLILLSLPLGARALAALAATPLAVQNIYQQQYQLARFLAACCPGEAVLINDIGAVAWLAPVRVMDIVGLASGEVAALKRQRRLDAAAVKSLADREAVTVVALYEDVFRPILPGEWVKVGDWTIPNCVAATDARVSFFSPRPSETARLAERLAAFGPNLPSAVEQRGKDRLAASSP